MSPCFVRLGAVCRGYVLGYVVATTRCVCCHCHCHCLQVRAKVFKCLSCVVEADSRVLGLADVAAAVRAALEDDYVAVREATLELLAKLIATNPTMASEYFDVLVTASQVGQAAGSRRQTSPSRAAAALALMTLLLVLLQ